MINLDALSAIHIAVIGAVAGALVTSAEGMWLWIRGAYSDRGIWAWPIIGEYYFESRLSCVALLIAGKRTLLLLTLRIIVSVAVVVCYYNSIRAAPLLLLLIVVTILLQLRTRWGGEGGDQMTLIVFVAALMADLFPSSKLIVSAVAIFIGAQITLAYVSSGTAKLCGPLWRRGTALQCIMTHYTYGHEWLSRQLTRSPRTGKLASWGTILFQVSFPLFYILPFPYAALYPSLGVLFHLGIAYFMRLNLFIFAFIATYPSLFVARESLRAALGLS
jgi:hypothetical protein